METKATETKVKYQFEIGDVVSVAGPGWLGVVESKGINGLYEVSFTDSNPVRLGTTGSFLTKSIHGRHLALYDNAETVLARMSRK